MHERGPVSFAALDTRERAAAFFEEHYASAAARMPTLLDDFVANPVGRLGTVLCAPWAYDDKLCLVGDAAHAFTPFFGQGCNCGFEDVTCLHELLLAAAARDGAGAGGAAAAAAANPDVMRDVFARSAAAAARARAPFLSRGRS